MKNAFLVGIYKNSKEKTSCEDHLWELKRLADTYGIATMEKLSCPLRTYDPATFLGKGKVQQIADKIQQQKAEVVIFDDEITPQQQRNLEKIFSVPVIDRTELILAVFAQRAQTKEAKIQVQLAQYQYQLPRLRRMWTHLERQRTGGAKGGFLKGPGERQIEMDRRLVKERIDRLKKELKMVQKRRELQKAARIESGIPSIAIIGYTNAGKSSLLNALTHAKVFVEDKLFATLDTTTRKFNLPNKQEIVLIDTVGFIRKLPHNLVASFKSTLEEAFSADILLHLIDASSSNVLEEAQATYAVLKELKAKQRPILTVLNKIDACKSRLDIDRVRFKFPKTVMISALKKEGLDILLEKITQELAKLRVKESFKIPQKHYALISELMRAGKVISSEYVGNDILIEVDMPRHLQDKFAPFRT